MNIPDNLILAFLNAERRREEAYRLHLEEYNRLDTDNVHPGDYNQARENKFELSKEAQHARQDIVDYIKAHAAECSPASRRSNILND